MLYFDVNDVKPSNKNVGYRARLFSKKLAYISEGKELSLKEQNYLMACIKYWKDWQKIDRKIDIETIQSEYVRNCNRYIIDNLSLEGYQNLSRININISREEMKKRLNLSGIEAGKIRKLIK